MLTTILSVQVRSCLDQGLDAHLGGGCCYRWVAGLL